MCPNRSDQLIQGIPMPTPSIAEAWETSKALLVPIGANQPQIDEIRRSFYLGAMATLRALSGAIRSGDNGALLDALGAISAELQFEAARRDPTAELRRQKSV
jgi:hypothetical protein